jgi:hypothetical protein
LAGALAATLTAAAGITDDSLRASMTGLAQPPRSQDLLATSARLVVVITGQTWWPPAGTTHDGYRAILNVHRHTPPHGAQSG